MNQTPKTPYEVATEGGTRVFLSVEEANNKTYLPWHALQRMRLNAASTHLIFEFAHESVEVSGNGLETIAELAASARLKSVRAGTSGGTTITQLLIIADNH